MRERPDPSAGGDLDRLYRHRFEDIDRADKDRVWKILCTDFFARYVGDADVVLDVGAGYCEFINHVRGARKVAVDANPELPQFAAAGVEVHVGVAQDLSFLPDASIDVAFTSNFFEHLPDKATLSELVKEVHRVLKPGGRLLMMGPNVKYLPGSYWDYFDHHIPLTEKSIEELVRLAHFEVEESLPRFMPYTVKSRLPKWGWLVKCYLRLGAIAFPIFGRQFFVVARKPPASSN